MRRRGTSLLLEEARKLLLEPRHTAATIEQLLGAPDPGRVRLGVDIEVQLVAFLAPGGARLIFGAIGHHDRNHMISRVNLGFHGRSFGAPAPVFRVAVGTDLGRSITQQAPQNKPSMLPDWCHLRICLWSRRRLFGRAAAIGPDFMSAVERLEDRHGETSPRRDVEPPEASSIEAQLMQPPAKGSARLRPLLALAPYVARYRGRATLALIALTIAALTTLLVPVAVRRMIDFGFTPEGVALINSYFSVMIAVVAVLAGASAARFYLVMTIGERIVADLRRDVVAHLISLSPAFFHSPRRRELSPRLPAGATPINSAVG